MWTREWWQWRRTLHSPKFQHYWNLTIRWFSVLSRMLNGVFYTLSQLGCELTEAIQRSYLTTVSSDEIHYEFLKRLPKNSPDYLLTTFNDILIDGRLPEPWKILTIIPISKLWQNSLNPQNYSPLALTRCLWKSMKHMVNKRLNPTTLLPIQFQKPKINSGSCQIGYPYKIHKYPKTSHSHFFNLE